MNKPSRQEIAGAAYFDLQNLARSTDRPTDELLQLYALEGFLDRLSASAHSESLRARVAGRLSRAKIRFHIDVNIGDPILPPPESIKIPRLLGGDPISLVGYARELVLAEKIVTAISRGTANTRWRDFVDIAALAQQPTDSAVLRSSIERVAAFRHVTVVPLGDVLEGFAEIAQPRWAGWRTKQRLVDEPEDFSDLLATVIDLVDPILAG